MFHPFLKVLAVTDFSEAGDAAIPFAYSVADPGGEIRLIHVLERSEAPNPLYAHYSPDDLALPEKRRQAEEKVSTHLRGLIPKTAPEKALSSSVQALFHTDVPEGIIDEATRWGADVIVIGSHGRTGLAHLLMGSVAEQVLRRSEVPVLVVPRKARR